MADVSPVNSETDSNSTADTQSIPGAFSVSAEPSAPPSPYETLPNKAPQQSPWAETFTRAMAETGGPIGIANVRVPSRTNV